MTHKGSPEVRATGRLAFHLLGGCADATHVPGGDAPRGDAQAGCTNSAKVKGTRCETLAGECAHLGLCPVPLLRLALLECWCAGGAAWLPRLPAGKGLLPLASCPASHKSGTEDCLSAQTRKRGSKRSWPLTGQLPCQLQQAQAQQTSSKDQKRFNCSTLNNPSKS